MQKTNGLLWVSDEPSYSGVYRIMNLANGKFYVGSAVNIQKRWRDHRRLLHRGTHDNRHLRNAWRKYGAESFIFSVLEECEKELLIEREQFFMDTLMPEYNIAPKAGSNFGVKYTPEARAKMSDIAKRRPGHKYTPEARAKMSAAHLGHKHTPEARAKISEARLGYKHTPETRAKMIGNKNSLGHRHTLETRAKISTAKKRLGEQRETE